MKTDPDADMPAPSERAKSLTQVLGQSEHVNELVKESAEELSSVNALIRQALANGDPSPDVKDALNTTMTIIRKVHEASEKLTLVNRALENEVRERQMLDHQMAALVEQKEGARDAAFHDVLTGLPNRALFNDRLQHGIEQAGRNHSTLAVMFIDLDEFKGINDTYGHAAGDIALKTVALRLKKNTRSNDTVSRHGGDEFLYLLTEMHPEKTIAIIAEKLIKAILAPFTIRLPDRKVEYSIGASVGISIFPRDGTTADSLVKSADGAMYHAKKNQSGYSFASAAPRAL